jgi:hypothetical protein
MVVCLRYGAVKYRPLCWYKITTLRGQIMDQIENVNTYICWMEMQF